ncbi:MAG: phytanoyl-CoA dioxygenase family protein [Burkholderiales bacterium]|nr:phytanoyl-CoA dioxygenase family protein [Burkholderiales bacterium]
MLTSEQIDDFHRTGFVHLRGFFDIDSEIVPILSQLHRLIGMIAEDEGIRIDRKPFSIEGFDDGLFALLAKDRRLVGRLYDAAKQLPSFCRLTASEKHEKLYRCLRGESFPAVPAGGQGIRIDLPGEERYRAPWHQDYPNQLRSMDGLVFWAPLRSVKPEMGPVELCVGSHRGGPLPVVMGDSANPDKTGAYGMLLHKEETVISGFDRIAPLSEVGDLLVFDYLLVHRSGSNVSSQVRWSMQMRFFNFAESTGRRIGWRGSFAAGVELASVHPDLVVQGPVRDDR